MKGQRLTPLEMKQKIERHFRAQGVEAELQPRLISRAGKRINRVLYQGRFISVDNFEMGIEIPFDGKYHPNVKIKNGQVSRISNYLVAELQNAVIS